MSADAGRDAGRTTRTLAVDASTAVGTVAVFVGGALAAYGEARMRGGADDAGLLPTLSAALREAAVRPEELDRIVCGAGPGSFTGLRVAASTAKGLAVGLGVTLVAVPSLALIHPAGGAPAPGRYLATMDAMRGERFASLLTLGAGGTLLEVGPVELHPAAAIARRAEALRAAVIGADGHPLATPRADRALDALAARGVDAAPVPLDAWEPAYGRVAEAQARWEAAHGRPLPRE